MAHKHTRPEEPRTPCTLRRADEHLRVITQEKEKKSQRVVVHVETHALSREEAAAPKTAGRSRSPLVCSTRRGTVWNTGSRDAEVHQRDILGWGRVRRGGGRSWKRTRAHRDGPAIGAHPNP